MSFLPGFLGLLADLEALRVRVDELERLVSCQNDPPGGQGGSTFDPPGPAEGPVQAAETPEKFPQREPPFFLYRNFPKKISGEE